MPTQTQHAHFKFFSLIYCEVSGSPYIALGALDVIGKAAVPYFTNTAPAGFGILILTRSGLILWLILSRVGDIGPKIGFNAMDNGYCSFDHVRIPRLNMAMRHQQVDRNGVYRRTASKEINKIAYITVTQASTLLCCTCCTLHVEVP